MRCVKTMRRRTEKIVEAWAKGTSGNIINPIPNNQNMPNDDYSSLVFCVDPVT